MDSQAPVQRVALVAGGTGLTGAALLQLLLFRSHEFARVHAITRRPLPLDHPRLANRILKLEELTRPLGLRCTDAFCCIGAPHGPRAPVAELRHVDVELVVAFARAAQAAGATRLVVVSAANAARDAPKPFQRCKGEMEAALRELRFASLEILQPGPVLGVRAQNSPADLLRMAVLPLLNPFLGGTLAPFRAIDATDLAAAMLAVARSQRKGAYTYNGLALRDLALAGRRQA